MTRTTICVLGLVLALFARGAGSADEVEVLGEATSGAAAIDLVNEASGYQAAEPPFSLAVDLVPELGGGTGATVTVDGVDWKTSETAETAVWTAPGIGVHEIRHMPGNLAVTCEVWSASLVLAAADTSLRDLLPTKYTSVTNVTLTGGADIPARFFQGCAALESVTLPTGLASIGADAFSGCGNLVRVDVPTLADWLPIDFANAAANPLSSGTVLYADGVPVTDLVVPDGTTTIGSYAFANYSNLVSVALSEGLISIGESAFEGCGAVFDAMLPSSVRSVGGRAFASCGNLVSVMIPSSVTNVGWMAFGDCPQLAEATVSAGALRMWGLRDIFFESWNITNFVLDASVENVHDGMFSGWSSLTSITLPSTVTNIGWCAFEYCSNLNTLSIPSGVVSIGSSAFYRCGLESLVIPAGTTNISPWAFSECTTIKSVILESPAVVASIRELFPDAYEGISSVVVQSGIELPTGFLKGCSSLKSFAVPGGMILETNAFAGCDNLTRIDFASLQDCLRVMQETLLPAGVVPTIAGQEIPREFNADGFWIVDGWVFGFRDPAASELTIPEGVVGIGSGALAEMYDLERVVFPESLKYIASSAFANDTYLDGVAIPDGVEAIGPGAFRDCSYIQTITFGSGLKTVGAEAFAGCTQLARAAFAEGLVSVGARAFAGDWRMQSVALPLSTEAVASDAFTGCSSLTGVTMPTHGGTLAEWFAPVSGQIRNVTVPDGETEVRSGMFSNCTALATASLPEGVTNVADGAFYNCYRLSEAALPRTVQAVGASAYRGCSALTAVVLPENVAELGVDAFNGCSSLNDLTLSRALTAIPDGAFAGCGRLTSFVVPESVKSLGARICAGGVTAIYYLGNAPACDPDVYAGTGGALRNYVINGTKGWDGRPQSRDLPSSWPVGNAYARPIGFWTANAFDVTFDANGGLFASGAAETYACEQVTYTGYSLPPFQPVRGGYRFAGYWTEREGGTRVTASTAVKLTKPHVLYAQWTVAPSITVRFNAMGGTVEPGSLVYTSGEPYGTFPVATREHHVFDGWWTAASGGRRAAISDEAPAADAELFARWRPCIYEILFHAENGSGLTASQLFTYGDAVTLAANRFTCAGCTFAGWALTPGGEAVYADRKPLGEVSAVQDGTIHLYATWAGRTYAVRFDANGGTGRMPNQTFVLGVAQNLATNGFAREGFAFKGWATTPSGGVAVEDGAPAIGLTERQNDTVVLYAVWARDGYSLEEALGGACGTLAVAGDADWVADTDVSRDGVASVRTAALGAAPDGETVSTTLRAKVRGSGRGSFQWKVHCEDAYWDDWYDYAVFAVDGVVVARIAGDADWAEVPYEIAENGTHELTWTFVRDDFDEPDAEWENRLWVDCFAWTRDLASFTVADVLDAPELSFASGGAAEWTVDAETSHDGSVSMRSGAAGASQESWIETTVTGAGELAFWWKVRGQVNGSRLYDYATCEVDGALVARAGLVDWTNVVVSVSNAGPHTVRWTYRKNASVDPEGDCAWLDEVAWRPAAELAVVVPAAFTGAADIVIPSAWFARWPRFRTCFGDDLHAAVLKPSGKPGPGGAARPVWHDYVFGTDPTDAADVFRATIAVGPDGRPAVAWEPRLPADEAARRVYTTYGRESPDGTWRDLSALDAAARARCRFFKVGVRMK